MQLFSILLGIPLGVAFTFYFRSFFKRMLLVFGADVRKKPVKIGLWVAAGAVGALCIDFLGFGGIIVLHLFAFAALLQFVNFLVKKIARKKYAEGCKIWKTIYGCGFLPILLTAVLVVGGYINLHNVVKTNYTVYTTKTVREEGYRVALLADTHFGVSLDYQGLLEVCEEVTAQEPDLVVLCGDIVDDSTTKKQMREVFSALASIQSEFGTFFVYGNHDRPSSYGIDYAFTADELVSTIEGLGIKILQDEIYRVADDLVLVGREDRSVERNGEKRLSIDALLTGVNKDAFILTLDHQPHEYKENGKAGTDLILSGHTHGGQLFPLQFVQKLFQMNDEVYGKKRIDSNTVGIVTSGVAGWRYPIKTAAPAEYVIVDIKNK
ncbi:MAG: metallophosphoesterase [Clostridia bacterium]|nr:metallophosphoesterase [Clostridia bacterium]